jgi:hypothetical protein
LKDREVLFIKHLKEEIIRLVADGRKAKMNKTKAAPKNNIRPNANTIVVRKKDRRFEKCHQCYV